MVGSGKNRQRVPGFEVSSFEGLRPGDRVRVTYLDPRADIGGVHEVVVERINTSLHGRTMLAERTALGNQGDLFYEVDNIRIEVLEWADGLPDADYFAWLDIDLHDMRVAVRYGHPANGVWRVEGTRMETADVIRQLKGQFPIPLDARR